MSNKRIPKKFKTSWGAEYNVYVNNTSDTTEDTETAPETNIKSETDGPKWESVLLVLIVIGLLIFGINHRSDQSAKKQTQDNFLESNSNSAFIIDKGVQEILSKNK
tara:strand:+ start:489 stop:806 length:318 start_codon:yes stop_codon:yes gene_type:complete